MKAQERVTTRTCLKCGKSKALAEFYAKPKVRCKACVSEASREQYQRTKDRVLARQAKYNEANKERITAYVAEWYEQNKDRVLERCRQYRQSPEVLRRERERQAIRYAANRDQILASRRAYYAANPEAKAAFAKYAKEFYRNNVPLYAAKTAKRRSRKLCATPAWADPKAITAVYRLAAKLSECTGVKHVVDHIVPLQGRNVCGLHVATNLQVIPEKDNLRKFNKHSG